jgi:hypothetical protein
MPLLQLRPDSPAEARQADALPVVRQCVLSERDPEREGEDAIRVRTYRGKDRDRARYALGSRVVMDDYDAVTLSYDRMP